MLQRMLVERIENRILIGVITFVGIMLLVGWVAINENARMASFDRQYTARSVERGAEAYAATCATCHGTDARGITGRAPALNSPLLFGHNYFADIDNTMGSLAEQEILLNQELADLADELVADGTTEERIEEITARREEISDLINGEEGINAQREVLAQERNALVSQLQPAVLLGYPITNDFDDNNNPITIITTSRLEQVGWGGSLHDFIFTTLVHGRPTSSSYWPEAMPPWSQQAGGPMRDDQVEDIVTYILNFDKGNDWTLGDALAVQQYPRVPGLGGGTGELVAPAGTDVDSILARIEEEGVEGDADRGEVLYTGVELTQRSQLLACSGCHAGATSAPATQGTWDRVINERLTLPQFADYSVEQYLIESIVHPDTYIVPGYSSGVMPGNLGQIMSVQDIADVIAYLELTSEEAGDTEDADEPADTGDAEATEEPADTGDAEATEEPAETDSAEATEEPADEG